MVFSSVSFLLYFLPVFLVLLYFTKPAYKNLLILFFSIFFYSWGAPKFVFILLGATVLAFSIVRQMDRVSDKGRRKQLLAASIILNLGLLAFFKYANFFVENLNGFLVNLGVNELGWTQVALPIGISFYTFQSLTYAIDSYRKVHKPLDKVGDYMLYIIMFPQLIAGPIVRFHTIADQIVSRSETNEDRIMGFIRFCIGLAKKVLIANVLGERADEIFAAEALDASTAWLGVMAYTFQIYFDFSGYSDMAIGIGRMIGFKFPENFNNPYTARSVTEFWRRWHITLGDFMKEYLYIPLGGNQLSAQRLYFNLILVFLLSGLWHGAAWNFILWGAYFGFFLVLERLFLKRYINNFIGLPYTFLVVVFGWVLFRADDLQHAGSYYASLFSMDFGPISEGPEFYFTLLLALFFSFFVLFAKGFHDKVYLQDYSRLMQIGMLVVAICLLGLSIAAITTSGFNPFIYFRF